MLALPAAKTLIIENPVTPLALAATGAMVCHELPMQRQPVKRCNAFRFAIRIDSFLRKISAHIYLKQHSEQPVSGLQVWFPLTPIYEGEGSENPKDCELVK